MTKTEIIDLLGLSSSTLSRWSESNNQKNKLFKLLENLDKEEAIKTMNKKPHHRIFHILNRNIKREERFNYNEIQSAFLRKSPDKATSREKIIYASFFKELELDDLESFVQTFKVPKTNIKKIYAQIPERKLKGVARLWDRRFRLKHLSSVSSTAIATSAIAIPSSLQAILDKRDANV